MQRRDEVNGKKGRSASERFQTGVGVLEGGNKDGDVGSPVSPLGGRAAITNTSSSSSSSGSLSGSGAGRKIGKSHSGELEKLDGAAGQRNWKPGHRRSGSGQLVFSGGSSATSPNANLLPAGNICPSGKIAKAGMMTRVAPRNDVLGSGTGNYGHGSIIRGGGAAAKAAAESPQVGGGAETAVKRAMASSDPEEVKRAGNEQYKMGCFADALKLYDRAIAMCPGNAACHGNRAAALIGLGRVPEAVKECELAVKLDPGYSRAHQRLASLYLRLGQVESAGKHIAAGGQKGDREELQKVQTVERHLKRCADVRKIEDWASVLRESEAAIAAGADSSPLLLAAKAEAHLRLHQLEEADSLAGKAAKLESSLGGASQSVFSGIICHAYVFFVQAMVEAALGRFENAVAAAERASRADGKNGEVAAVFASVKAVARARSRGNELFKAGMFAEACGAYGEGLRFDSSNPVLYCNRAVCFSKLGQWEKSVQDCNQALRIYPNYAKALLRRAASSAKLERWGEAVRDYELLRKLLPGDSEVAESLFRAKVALKTSRGEDVSNLTFGGEVEKITGVEHFRAAISLPSVSVVHFSSSLNQQCLLISPFVDSLCSRFPCVNFLKVDVDESPEVASSEGVKIVPTFKIYKQGSRVKEMICPSKQVLEYSVVHYGV
ncbi:TPR repeat-containing thioredoxin TTL1-like [Wolffia australiana]